MSVGWTAMVHGARSARRLARFVSMPDARNLEVITDDRPSGAAEFHLCAELARGRAPFKRGGHHGSRAHTTSVGLSHKLRDGQSFVEHRVSWNSPLGRRTPSNEGIQKRLTDQPVISAGFVIIVSRGSLASPSGVDRAEKPQGRRNELRPGN